MAELIAAAITLIVAYAFQALRRSFHSAWMPGHARTDTPFPQTGRLGRYRLSSLLEYLPPHFGNGMAWDRHDGGGRWLV